MTLPLKDTNSGSCTVPYTKCVDCKDMHTRNIAHACHCHELPSLGEFIDQPLQGIFYVRERDGSKLVGIRLLFDTGMLSIFIKNNKLEVEVGRSL